MPLSIRFRWLVPVLALLVALGALAPADAALAQGGPNLLNNPGFEGQYVPYTYPNGTRIGEFHIAAGWNPWFNESLRRPEYKPGNYSYNGSASQQYFTSYSVHQAGLWQRVENATPGRTYRFSIGLYIWSSSEGDIFTSVQPGNVNVRIGIDPTGGTNPYAGTVVWSPFAMYYDEWRFLSVDAVAQSNALTVFTWSQPVFPVVHNDIALDQAYLGEVAAAPAPTQPAAPAVEQAQPVQQPPAVATQPPAPVTVPAAPTAAPGAITLRPLDDLRLRASIYGETLDVIPAGVPVVVLGRTADRNWALVEYNGQQGWVASWLGRYSAAFDTIPVVEVP